MIVERPSPNHDARPAGGDIDILLLHYTGMTSAEAALSRLCDAAALVSAHYLIDEEGTVFALVAEDRRAWHAGVARWAGHADINGCSIGVELVNPGHEFGYRAFPKAQMAALLDLCTCILRRHAIPAHRVLGHADVAPARREDPGELFDWAALAAAGVGLWPPPKQGNGLSAAAALANFGYDVQGAGLDACATAFQRHWRPKIIDGRMDAECLDRLAGLLDLIA
ncbi:MAG: N-acetylmuramoyl-L-alanine amidase [Proteobacteria bacterium]|nr:N-acetylmuramoyl-L-alanine amidase [Pseudomonadota bacterium]